MIGVGTAVVVQTVFSVVRVAVANRGSGLGGLKRLPWWVYVIGLVWGLVAVAIDETVKWRDRLKFTRIQRRLKLEYQTMLGMHSPR